MDAASAAAMCDPDLNTDFRRRWSEGRLDDPVRTSQPADTAIGTLGIALQEALCRAALSADAGHMLQLPEGLADG